MTTTLKLTKYDVGTHVEHTLYRGMVGITLYLTASRLEISFTVDVC